MGPLTLHSILILRRQVDLDPLVRALYELGNLIVGVLPSYVPNCSHVAGLIEVIDMDSVG